MYQFSSGKFVQMMKFLKYPKLYEEFKNYENIFSIKLIPV